MVSAVCFSVCRVLREEKLFIFCISLRILEASSAVELHKELCGKNEERLSKGKI